ncbi:DUF427 domain-containing protein [Tundrisphaera sp. TA3]|uniref:DUF427 domain-containing protein n=1 Tax=Tundrisphaera sp. TA3 TaxID=3435775 RepID=UPI003EB9F857
MNITIREKQSGKLLASAPEGSELVVPFEGNLYFDTSVVEEGSLRVTDRTYTCPHKGVCQWIDFVDPLEGRTVRDVGWVYNKPKPGNEVIQGRYGFYAGTRGGTKQA